MKILKFFSRTCGPCKQMSKTLEQVHGVEIKDLDIENEENIELIHKYNIRSVPTIIILDNNNRIIREFKGIVALDEIQSAISCVEKCKGKIYL